jgi:exodeoxyribonuclease V alpha subunit
MQIRNNYDLCWETLDKKNYGSGIYNGDIGIVESIKDDIMEVIFDDEKVVEYTQDAFEELEHAYAITVHKSQGSEFPVVVMPLITGSPLLYTRNLLYTGVTRAKELLVIVGDSKVVNQMIANNNTKRRNTGLQYKLNKYFDIFNKQ